MQSDIKKRLLSLLMLIGFYCSGGSASASVADLFITEVMANPTAVSDTNGEWFELYNPTAGAVDLAGITLSDDGANSHNIADTTPLLIDPGSYFVLARNGDPLSNGGFDADYVYSGFSLGNTDDEIIFSDSTGELLRLAYASGFVAAGQSTELLSLPMDGANYGLTDPGSVYGLGDTGTPGTAGAFTPAPVPLPGAVWLFGSGLAGLIGVSRRRHTMARS